MALTDYCQLDEVRSALGVNSVELSDAVLNLPVYAMGLVRELNKISTSLPAAFSTIKAKAAADRTAQEAAVYDATSLFAVYAAARQVGVSLANFTPKEVTDSKAGVARFSADPYKDTMERIDDMCTQLRTDLATAMSAYSGGDTITAATLPATMVKAVQRTVDPVTGA